MASSSLASPVGEANSSIRGSATGREERAAAARAALESVALPVDHLNFALPHLRRPFSAAAVKWKVQSTWPRSGAKEGAVIVAYIDARLVVERLNAVVGGAWHAEYRQAAKEQLLLCDLTVFGTTRTDVGESSKGPSKDLISDSLKRSAVMFGVGVSVYALPQHSWKSKDNPTLLKAKGQGQYATLVLTQPGHQALRTLYEQWLQDTGVPAFGPVLDHGDVVSEVEPDAEVDEDAFVPAEAPALDDERALALVARAREAYKPIAASEVAVRKFPPAQFNAWLENALRVSHEELERVTAYVESRRDELVGSGAA